jgi:hypothetical protein
MDSADGLNESAANRVGGALSDATIMQHFPIVSKGKLQALLVEAAKDGFDSAQGSS